MLKRIATSRKRPVVNFLNVIVAIGPEPGGENTIGIPLSPQ